MGNNVLCKQSIVLRRERRQSAVLSRAVWGGEIIIWAGRGAVSPTEHGGRVMSSAEQEGRAASKVW